MKTLAALLLSVVVGLGAGFVSASSKPQPRQGCCSSHGGVCGCSLNHAVCCDGSVSKSCDCN